MGHLTSLYVKESKETHEVSLLNMVRNLSDHLNAQSSRKCVVWHCPCWKYLDNDFFMLLQIFLIWYEALLSNLYIHLFKGFSLVFFFIVFFLCFSWLFFFLFSFFPLFFVKVIKKIYGRSSGSAFCVQVSATNFTVSWKWIDSSPYKEPAQSGTNRYRYSRAFFSGCSNNLNCFRIHSFISHTRVTKVTFFQVMLEYMRLV